jgi:DNA-binding IclR family transcriptional regulator
LTRHAQGLTLTELGVALNSPKSRLLALLRPLVASRYLTLQDNQYQLGPSIFQLSMNVMAGRSYASLARIFLEELADRSGESVYLTSIDLTQRVVTYMDVIESRQAVRYAVGAGATRPLFVSAAGRALLAFQEDQWVESFLLDAPFASPVQGKNITARQLREDLKRVREDGVAVSLSQAVEGAAGVAAPILKSRGYATHALLIAAPLERMKRSLPEMKALITEVAQRAQGALSNAHIQSPVLDI